jgi:hypothetical protein
MVIQKLMLELTKRKIKKHLSGVATLYILVAFLGFVLIFSVGLTVQLKTSNANLKTTLDTIVPELSLLLSTKSYDKLAQELDTDQALIQQDISPFSTYVGLDKKINADLNSGTQLLKSWLNAIKPLLNYKLTSKGIVSADATKYFTNDLSDFFDSLGSLYAQTQAYWNSTTIYRFFLTFVGNENLNRYFDIFSVILDKIPVLINNKNSILAMLGHFSTQKIVIFNQNNGEARPNGGFTGSYIPVDIFKGRISIGQSESIYNVSNAKENQSFSPPPAWYYGYLGDYYVHDGLHNSNFFSCVDDSAKLLEQEFSASKTGYSIDNVVFMNSTLLRDILPANFSITVDSDLTINSDNILDEIERLTSLEAQDPTNPKAELTGIFTSIIDSLDGIIAGDTQGFLLKMMNFVLARDIQMWFKDPNLESFWQSTIFAPDKNCRNLNSADFISPMIGNLSVDKRNLVTQNQFNIYAKRINGLLEIDLKYKQILPDQINLQRGFNDVSPLTFVGLQLPKNVSDVSVRSDQGQTLPFLAPYYGQYIQSDYGKALVMPDQINTVVSSSRDLPNGGFTYFQPDGSQVLGIYIVDQQTSEVDFSFKVPLAQNALVTFYGQPGLNQPTLSLGNGASFKGINENFTTDPKTIAQGVPIIFD